MEKSRSWSSAHDWKSCRRQKRLEGSNPSFSAKCKRTPNRVFFFAFRYGVWERDSKGACKKTVRWTVFPRHRSARRRANPSFSAKCKRTPNRVFFFAFRHGVWERDSKGACKKTVRWTVFPRHRSARRRANPSFSAKCKRTPNRVFFFCIQSCYIHQIISSVSKVHA